MTGEVAIIPSKRMRNKIAGFVTHLMKRIQRGPVRGISLKLQEEERERRLDFVPEVDDLILCIDTKIIFSLMDCVSDYPSIAVTNASASQGRILYTTLYFHEYASQRLKYFAQFTALRHRARGHRH